MILADDIQSVPLLELLSSSSWLAHAEGLATTFTFTFMLQSFKCLLTLFKSFSSPVWYTNLQGISISHWGKSCEYWWSPLTVHWIVLALLINTAQRNDIFLGMWPTTISSTLHTVTAYQSLALSNSLFCKITVPLTQSPYCAVHVVSSDAAFNFYFHTEHVIFSLECDQQRYH